MASNDENKITTIFSGKNKELKLKEKSNHL